MSKNILDLVISYGIKPVKVGENTYRSHCIFHNDVGTPNLTIYPISQSWYCYSCSQGGDIFDFLSLAENISKSEAIKLYGDQNLETVLDLLTDEEEKDCSVSLNFTLSNLCRNYIQKNPEKLDKVINILRLLDKRVNLFVSLKESIKIMSDFETRLKNL